MIFESGRSRKDKSMTFIPRSDTEGGPNPGQDDTQFKPREYAQAERFHVEQQAHYDAWIKAPLEAQLMRLRVAGGAIAMMIQTGKPITSDCPEWVAFEAALREAE